MNPQRHTNIMSWLQPINTNRKRGFIGIRKVSDSVSTKLMPFGYSMNEKPHHEIEGVSKMVTVISVTKIEGVDVHLLNLRHVRTINHTEGKRNGLYVNLHLTPYPTFSRDD